MSVLFESIAKKYVNLFLALFVIIKSIFSIVIIY